MKTSERFTNAVTKLYNAFHNGTLNAMDCKACAVGNICNNSAHWSGSYIAPETGYSREELYTIENLFMFGTKDENSAILPWRAGQVNSSRADNKVFEALCAVIEYLCEIEGIHNVMDYTSLFETEADQPKHKLEEVFA